MSDNHAGLLTTIANLRRDLPKLTAAREQAQAAFNAASQAEHDARNGLEHLLRLAKHYGLDVEVVPQTSPAEPPKPATLVQHDLLPAIAQMLLSAGEPLRAADIHARLMRHPEQLRNPNPARATVTQALSENKHYGWKLFGTGNLAKWGVDPDNRAKCEETARMT